MEKEDRSTHITGPVTNSPISSGNFLGPVTYDFSGNSVKVADSISISKDYLRMMPREYADSLERLTNKINEELKKERVPPDRITPLQESANDLAKELTNIKPMPETMTFEKKNTIGSKLIKFGKAIARASPTIARIVIGMTPLAPISGLVGESFSKIVEHVLAEEQH